MSKFDQHESLNEFPLLDMICDLLQIFGFVCGVKILRLFVASLNSRSVAKIN